jgi:hypothetical protein
LHSSQSQRIVWFKSFAGNSATCAAFYLCMQSSVLIDTLLVVVHVIL